MCSDGVAPTRSEDSGDAGMSGVPQNCDSQWQIVKNIYECTQPDDSVVVRVAYVCPVASCGKECDDLECLAAHMSDTHGVAFNPDVVNASAGAESASDGHPPKSVLPDREPCVCPRCSLQFAVDGKAQLLKHLAEVHGVCYYYPGAELQGESDHMDLLFKAASEHWYPRRDELLQRMHVISLGSYCGMKMSIQRMGLGEAHLPFDWVRTTCGGVRDFVRNKFEGFFSVASKVDVAGKNMTMYRSDRHSFWHDDIVQEAARAKLRRRIDRFLALCEDSKDLLFVRGCATTDELSDVEDLYAALCEQFGSRPGAPHRRVLLAVVIDGQGGFEGPILHTDLPGVVFFTQLTDLKDPSLNSRVFCRAIACAADAALAVPECHGPSVGFGLNVHAQPSTHLCVPSAGTLIGDTAGGATTKKPLVNFWGGGLDSGINCLRCFEDPDSQKVCVDLGQNDACPPSVKGGA